MLSLEIGVAAAMGAAAIVGLVGVAWRTLSPRRRARTRPASPDVLTDRHRTLRAIAAASYRQQAQHEPDGKDPRR